MAVKALIDPKKKEAVARALANGDFSGILAPKKTAIDKPAVGITSAERLVLNSALHDACRDGNANEVERLLKAGADADAKDKDTGWTALIVATMNQHKEVVKLLIVNRVDVDAKTETGWTALMFAATWNYNAGLQLLIFAGADVNAKNDDGETALMKATGGKHTEIAELLKLNGAVE